MIEYPIYGENYDPEVCLLTAPWCEVIVEEAPKPGENNLNGMLVYNGTVANNTTVILKNANDSYTTTNVFEWNKY